ncbi:hypothetical protein HOD75_00675 [archaeon]|jgi:2-(3-amino-3-carboxypropyl)histidine synthase|nr:hypothetical protein [archaeon]MBT4241390.1 hypothetical protein [archaeon]MBT4418211.1 hypothetical protein [archaeon]
MRQKTIQEIEEIYDLELDRILKKIKNEKAEKVLLQFPEGLKPYAQVISDFVEENTNCSCFIWIGSCFGGCDVPLDVERLGIDLIVQFGHSNWDYTNKNVKIV